jgi:hypothetical protein
MTDGTRGTGVPDRSPWSVDLLADLHAGVLDPRESAQLWAQVNTDPQARAIIDALDSVKDGLEQLRDAPAPPMPAHFAARLDAALDAEARRAFSGPQAGAPVIDLAEARRKRSRRMAWGVGALTAAAAAVAVTVAVLPGTKQTTDGVAAPVPSASEGTNAEPPLALKTEDIGSVAGQLGGKKDYGPLKDQAGLDKCLETNGLDPAKAQTIGVRPVTLDEKPGVMAMLTTGEATKFRILVVQADCTKLFNGTIGR